MQPVPAPHRQLVGLPDATAVRVIEATLQGETVDLTPQADEVVTALFRRLRIVKLQAYAANETLDPARAELLVRVERQRRDRDLRDLAPPERASELDELSDLLAVAHGLRIEATTLPPADRSKILDEAFERLNLLSFEISSERRGDLECLRLELLELQTELFVDQDLTDAADRAFRQQMEQAETTDRWVPGGRYHRRALVRYCDWLAKADADGTLRRLLPLSDIDDDEPDVDSLALQTLRAQFFDRFGDHYEARKACDRLRSDLETLGFRDSLSGDYQDVIEQWIVQALSSHRSHVERYRLFNQVCTSYIGLHALAARAPDGDGDLSRMEALGALFFQLRQAENRQVESELTMLARTDGDPPSPFHLPEAPSLTSLQRYSALARQWETEGSSEQFFRDCLELWNDPAEPIELRARTAILMAQASAMVDDWEVAAGWYEGAGRWAAEQQIEDVLLEARKGMGLVWFATEDYARASAILGLAIESVERMRREVTSPYLASAFMSDKADLYALGIESARRTDELGEMLKRMELVKARDLVRPTSDRSDTIDLRRRILELGTRALEPDLDPVHLRRLTEQRRSLWQQARLAQSYRDESFDLGALQQRLSAGVAVLAYFFTSEASLLVALIREESVTAERVMIDPEGPFYPALQRIERAHWKTPGLSWDLEDLAEVLLPESLAPHLSAASQLIVCPHQALHGVPFPALPFKTSALIEHLPVGSVPNLTCLLREPTTALTGGSLMALATRKSKDSRGEELPPLDGVEDEARAAVCCWRDAGFDASVLLHEEVRRETLFTDPCRVRLTQARVLHLALHGEDVATADLAESPMECRLFLADGPLDGLDLTALDLAAEVVVLAACFAAKRAVSARHQARLPSDSVFGLQAALHEAGVKAILGALWPANDSATPMLTLPFYQALAEGSTITSAFRRAVVSYLRDAGPIWEDPAFWACFTLVGFGPEPFGLDTSRSHQT